MKRDLQHVFHTSINRKANSWIKTFVKSEPFDLRIIFGSIWFGRGSVLV